MAKRVISVPVLAALGVTPDGQKRLLSLRLAVSEASTHWGSMLEGLQAQGLRAPKLVISDGHKGLTKALEKWPGCRVQRCTEHKRANLLEHCPAHARRELRRDYNRIVYAKNGIDARKAYDELVAKWTPLTPAVVRSLEEAGNQLLTFYEFPRVSSLATGPRALRLYSYPKPAVDVREPRPFHRTAEDGELLPKSDIVES